MRVLRFIYKSSKFLDFVFLIFGVRFFPLFRAHVLGTLDFREDFLIEAEILDGVASNVDFLDAMKDFAILTRRIKT